MFSAGTCVRREGPCGKSPSTWELSRPECLETASLESPQVRLMHGSVSPKKLLVWGFVNLAEMSLLGQPLTLVGSWIRMVCPGTLLAPGTSLTSCWLFSEATWPHCTSALFMPLLTSTGIASQCRSPSAGHSEAERYLRGSRAVRTLVGAMSGKRLCPFTWLSPEGATWCPHLFP